MEVPWQKTLIDAARRNHGLITQATLVSTCLSKDHLLRAKRKGIIEPVLPGIYRIAGSPPNRAGDRAAVSSWGGRGSALSHWTAAELHEIDIPLHPEIHLSTERDARSPSSRIIVHRKQPLPPALLTRIGGLTATGPARTLLDLGAVAPPEVWETALDTFLRRGLRLDEFAKGSLSSPRRGKPGARMIRGVLNARRMESGVPEEVFERRFIHLVRKAGLGLPVSQYKLRLPNGAKVRIDFAYPEQRIAIEAQSYSWHSDRRSWERDRARMSELASLGWLVIEVTWRQLNNDPGAVVARLSRAINLRSKG